MNLNKILIPGKKYTILKFDEKGWLYSTKFELEAVTYRYINTEIKYTLVVSGSKALLKWHKWIKLEYHEQFVIWEGHHPVDTDIVVSERMLDANVGHCLVQQRWPAFDARYLIRAITKLENDKEISPIAKYLEPLQPEVLLTYQCIS